jgi:hypothetical protein
MLSSCGLLCETCYAFPTDCPGCDKLEGKPSWLSDIGKSVCELYQCARDRGITSCGGCAVLPCRQFVELLDPSLSVEEHLGHVNKRVEKLKKAHPSALPSSVRNRIKRSRHSNLYHSLRYVLGRAYSNADNIGEFS